MGPREHNVICCLVAQTVLLQLKTTDDKALALSTVFNEYLSVTTNRSTTYN